MRELRYGKIWWSVGWVLIALVVLVSLYPIPPADAPTHDKLGHFLMYFILMGWFAQLRTGSRALGRWAVGFILLGIALEGLQSLTPTRQMSLADALANSAGVGAALALAFTPLGSVLRRFERLLAHVNF